MAKFTAITNGQFVNQYDSAVRITAFGAMTGETDKGVEIYSTELSVPSGQFSISMDPVLGKTRAINDIFNKRGNLGGSTSGEVQLSEKTTSITLKTDFVYLNANKKGIEMSKNILDAMLKGEGFIQGGKYVKVLGSAGTVKHGFNTRMNKFFGKLVELDGRLIVPDAATEKGNAITVANNRKTAYDKTCNYIMIELISKFDDQTADGLRLVYTMNGDISFSDATDANEVSFTNTQLCDVRYVDKFMIEGWDAAGEVGTAVPARKVQLAKAPVSMFKANTVESNIDIGWFTSGAAPEDEGVALLVNTTGKLPSEVVVSNMATGEYQEEDYTQANNDIILGYLGAGDNNDPAYYLAVRKGTFAATITAIAPAETIASIDLEDKTLITSLANSTVVINGDYLAFAAGKTNGVVKVTSIPDPGTGVMTFEIVYTGALIVDGEINTDAVGWSIYKITQGASGTGFMLVKNDYRINESDVERGKYFVDEADCTQASIQAKTLDEALVYINDFDFEQSVFRRIEDAASCAW